MSIPTEASNQEQLSRLDCHGHPDLCAGCPFTCRVMVQLDQHVIDDTTPTDIGEEEVPLDLSFIGEEEKEETLGEDRASRQSSLGGGRHYEQPQPAPGTIPDDHDADADATFEDDELYIPSILRDEWLTDNPGKTEQDYRRVRHSRRLT